MGEGSVTRRDDETATEGWAGQESKEQDIQGETTLGAETAHLEDSCHSVPPPCQANGYQVLVFGSLCHLMDKRERMRETENFKFRSCFPLSTSSQLDFAYAEYHK